MPRFLAQNVEEVVLVLTEVLVRVGERCREVVVEVLQRQLGVVSWRGRWDVAPGLQLPRASARVCCGPREAVWEVKKPTVVLNCGKNLTHRRWVFGEIREDGAVQWLKRWSAWLLNPRRSTAATCGDGSAVER